MPLFSKQPKTVAEWVKTVRECLPLLDTTKKEKKSEKASEDLCRCLNAMRCILYGNAEQETTADQTAAIAQELYNNNLLLQLVIDLPKIEFEGRKDFALVFNAVLRRQVGTMMPTVDFCCKNKSILFLLLRGYENAEIALNSGTMLRECIKHESLARILLESDEFYDFFKYIELSSFDLASDAFLTFKELLTRHKALSAQFLEKNYDRFFTQYAQLLSSENYVTKRQALKLLGELLLDRFNFSVMTKYISNADNLKMMMNLLRSKQRNIQFEAFHVFKVFVANPNKPQPILEILLRNKDKLVEFLSQFHNDRTDDEQFNDEKTYLIRQIRELRPLAAH